MNKMNSYANYKEAIIITIFAKESTYIKSYLQLHGAGAS